MRKNLQWFTLITRCEEVPLVVRSYSPAVPPTPSHRPKKPLVLVPPRRPPSRERQQSPPPKRPDSRTRFPLQRQSSVHSLPSSPTKIKVESIRTPTPSYETPRRALSRENSSTRASSASGTDGRATHRSPSKESKERPPTRAASSERAVLHEALEGKLSMTPEAEEDTYIAPVTPNKGSKSPKTPSKRRLQRETPIDDPDTAPLDPVQEATPSSPEKTTNPAIVRAVEHTIQNMYKQVTIPTFC